LTDGLLRLGASVKHGWYPATEALDRFGSAAAGDPVYEASLRRVDPADLFRLCAALEVGAACFLDGIPDPEAGSEENGED